MNCSRKLTDSLYWVGANDRRIALFENVYPVPRGVSYNSYLLLDEKTALFDTIDQAFTHQLLENVSSVQPWQCRRSSPQDTGRECQRWRHSGRAPCD